MTFAEARNSPRLKRLRPWIWSALPVLLILEAQAVAPVGHWSLLFLEVPYLFGMLAAAGGLLVLPFLLLRRKNRMLTLAWLLATIVYLCLAIGALRLGNRVRYWAFDRLAQRSQKLVAAIQTFTATNGAPPRSLHELVPEHLPRVPDTGIMAYPSYRYYSGAAAQQYQSNSWVLIVSTPSGFLSFDQFMYFPLQNYPRQGYGGSLVRIRDWAYVHE